MHRVKRATPFDSLQGHSIECRINAEDPFKNFRPGPGRVVGYLAPGGPYVRMDSHMYPDYLVSPHPSSCLTPTPCIFSIAAAELGASCCFCVCVSSFDSQHHDFAYLLDAAEVYSNSVK